MRHSLRHTLVLLILSVSCCLARLQAQALQSPPAPTLRVAYVTPVLESRTPNTEHRTPSPLIFADNFDSSELRKRYFEYNSPRGSFLWENGEGYGGSGGAMRCLFDKGQVEAGSLKVVFGKNPFDRGPRRDETFREIYWRVYVKHQPGWEGNPAKLARATCLAGTNWSQGFIAHVWGGKDDTLCIDPATGIRNGRKVTTRYNDFANLRWLGLRNTQTSLFSPAESGRWVCVESRVKLNTSGKADGVFMLWIDGKLEASRTDLDWHGVWEDYAINAVFLENYWNTGSVKKQVRWFDNFVISMQPIGPVTLSATPILTRTEGSVEWEAQAASDPTGRDVVWTSKPSPASVRELKIDTKSGTFSGSCRTRTWLVPDTAYWLRLRQKDAAGQWSDWSLWHSPFHTRP